MSKIIVKIVDEKGKENAEEWLSALWEQGDWNYKDFKQAKLLGLLKGLQINVDNKIL